MNEEKNIPDIDQEIETATTTKQVVKDVPKTSMKLWILAGVVMLGVAGGLGFYMMSNKDSPEQNSQATDKVITSFEECADAGNPIQETYPEVCVTPDGKSFVNEMKEQETSKVVEVHVDDPVCNDTQSPFFDIEFGAAFCYPTEWGDASVMDAKIDSADTGYREAVRFSATTKFIVGGVSEDWTTTVGRDVGCQEPSNNIPELSSYNVDWHDLIGEGMDVEFATRSLPVTAGGYDLTETVSNLLQSGVCAVGHKKIDGTRYKVISVAYYSDFSDAKGITTPKAHLDNPAILFTEEERQQLDLLLASIVSYY